MSSTVSGSIQASVNLTTTFTSGTAGTATETNNIATSPIQIGIASGAGREFTDVWSHTYTNIASAFEIDLTALPGVGGRTVDFSPIGVRLILAINSDPAVDNDIEVGPGGTNAFSEPWLGTGGAWVVFGGMPGAGVAGGKPVGNSVFHSFCTPTGLAVDSTHKQISIGPAGGTVTSFTLVIAG